jgi:hypothetical protein
MACVVDLNALRHQALATALAASSQSCSAAFGFHPGAEPELPFPGTLGSLIGSFHVSKSGSVESREGNSERGIVKHRAHGQNTIAFRVAPLHGGAHGSVG